MKKLNVSPWILLILFACNPLFTDEVHGREDEREWRNHFENMEARARDLISEAVPEAKDLVRQLKEKTPEIYEELVMDVGEQWREIEEMLEDKFEGAPLYEKIFKSELKIRILEIRLGLTEDPEKKNALRKQLKILLPEAFELRIQENEFELKRLREEVQEVEAELHRRKELREKIIERRYREIVGEEREDELAW